MQGMVQQLDGLLPLRVVPLPGMLLLHGAAASAVSHAVGARPVAASTMGAGAIAAVCHTAATAAATAAAKASTTARAASAAAGRAVAATRLRVRPRHLRGRRILR